MLVGRRYYRAGKLCSRSMDMHAFGCSLYTDIFMECNNGIMECSIFHYCPVAVLTSCFIVHRPYMATRRNFAS